MSMTPEKLIVKYKEKITGFLDEDDREVMEAYINHRVQEESSRVRWFVNFTDNISVILLIGVMACIIAAVLGYGCTSMNVEDAVNKVKQENANHLVEIQMKHDEEIKELIGERENFQKENDKLKDMCINRLLGGDIIIASPDQ